MAAITATSSAIVVAFFGCCCGHLISRRRDHLSSHYRGYLQSSSWSPLSPPSRPSSDAIVLPVKVIIIFNFDCLRSDLGLGRHSVVVEFKICCTGLISATVVTKVCYSLLLLCYSSTLSSIHHVTIYCNFCKHYP
jgi:hypothetical protein